MKGNEAYGCTASDFIPTGENVTYYYDQAILPVNISTRKNIAYGHICHTLNSINIIEPAIINIYYYGVGAQI